MDVATWVIAAVGVVTILAGAVKFGMDLASVKKEIKPNGGNSHSLGDVVVNVRDLLSEHLEQTRRREEQVGEILIQGQKDLLSAIEKSKGP